MIPFDFIHDVTKWCQISRQFSKCGSTNYAQAGKLKVMIEENAAARS